MHLSMSVLRLIASFAVLCFNPICCAQEKPAEKTKAAVTDAAAGEDKKTVREVNLNLHTTITGNQEQPRVLYILPWQSPAPEDVDFEALDNQQKATFNHVEREELRRELESANE